MKFILSILIIFGFIAFFPSTAYACLGFGCKTDLAILGEVVSIDNTIATVKPFHIFPNSEISNQNNVQVEDIHHELQIGKKYALALSLRENAYVPGWEMLEVEGTSYENAKLLRLKNGDDASLQWWINTNGKKPEFNFYGLNNKLFIRVGNSESPFFQDIQVYPKRLPAEQLVLIIIGSFALGSVSTYILCRKKKKK